MRITISRTIINHLRLHPRIQDVGNQRRDSTQDTRISRTEINHFNAEDLKKKQLQQEPECFKTEVNHLGTKE